MKVLLTGSASSISVCTLSDDKAALAGILLECATEGRKQAGSFGHISFSSASGGVGSSGLGLLLLASTPIRSVAVDAGVTGQKLNSCVYSPNTEPALCTLLCHPEPLPSQGKRAFQPTPRLCIPGRLTIPRLATRRSPAWPRSKKRVWLDTRKNFLLLRDVQKGGEFQILVRKLKVTEQDPDLQQLAHFHASFGTKATAAFLIWAQPRCSISENMNPICRVSGRLTG
ncbi:uncharacterized protein LOC132542377 [Erinaceus europaeus]|uniref:Uncharacterized protein LOC132542377 n=1 Tax=Erinaceus europaeus TaxID=9365 RepID=A0ABM3YIN0_ERIEU|nr:uncharacterized protein LOC132542377 [Erinaceus europaeus]